MIDSAAVTVTQTGLNVRVHGIVQGVGFRPFVYALAQEFSLKGWVRNSASGVEIAVDGDPRCLDGFVDALNARAPPLAKIDQLLVLPVEPQGFDSFEIISSDDRPAGFQPISPDIAICPDCLSELFNPQDRRYRYPFINCTNCGPRFTIISEVPYDRPHTTMAEFDLCPACRAEYENPLDRRFHAQPVACPECGPHIWIEPGGLENEDALQAARELLRDGRIMAMKGLGGFHLACDATNPEAVRLLRSRKLRVDKPFALMMPDIEAVEEHCHVSENERQLLMSREHPIVLLQRRRGSRIADEVAPHQPTWGVMLPYTPLHHLLLKPEPGFPRALVMTSGNRSREPITITNRQAHDRIGRIADAFLLHDREIHVRCDDPVVRIYKDAPYPIRLARGYAPATVELPWEMEHILAAGGELKNTFCLTRERYAFVSQHIGDLSNYETLSAYAEAVNHFERLFRIQPVVLAYDLHPDYLATRYAVERAEGSGLRGIGVQHHHAHIAACMAEHSHPENRPVIGVALDGTGYGTDGTIWGGEFLVADYRSFHRAYWLRPVPLPGGDTAVRQPWRSGLAWLHAAGMNWKEELGCVIAPSKREREVVRLQIESRTNAPLTSSMGRLFDAVSSIAGVCQLAHYEGQAAIELEALMDPAERGAYPIEIGDGPIDPRPALLDLRLDLSNGIPLPVISARFHNGIARMILETCESIRREEGIDIVALSGGVWQNQALLMKTVPSLEKAGFDVYIHRQVPANDGGLSLGQAVIAHHSLHKEPLCV